MNEPLTPSTARLIAARLEVAMGILDSGRIHLAREQLHELLTDVESISEKEVPACTDSP